MVIEDIGDFVDRRVCILGLGYVGLTLAVSMADVGFEVLGVEIRKSVLDLLGSGKAHFHEPGLERKLHQVTQSNHLKFAQEIPSDWVGSVFIITVGTPLAENGRSRLDMIENAARQVVQKLKTGGLIIMRSTVKLGTTRKTVMPILDSSGYKYELAFCPERTLEGNALAEIRTLPQIVGGLTYGAGIRASQLFQFLTPTVVRVSDIETAEMIKLVDNAQRDVAFAYANEVARACDAIGVSAAEVIQAGRLGYPRTNLPMPGPVGGPCLEKDSHILAEGLRELGVEIEITMAARRTNQNQPAEIVTYIESVISTFDGFAIKPVITLMGIAFKGRPATDDLRGTMAKPILAHLRKTFPHASFRGYDEVVSESEIRSFGLEPVKTLEEAFAGTSLLLILNNHPVFDSMPINDLSSSMMAPSLIYDFWNCFKNADLHLSKGVTYMALGSHGRANLPGPVSK
jgi:UDP-N-acetyl-D-mannosaminuronic acid dehydrogenase